jgi:hypothetical protein
MRRPGKCVHYTGAVNECCAAGVNYQQLAGPGEAWGLRLPCHSADYRTGSGRPLPRADAVAECPHRREPTTEEVAADEKAANESIGRIDTVRAAVVAHLGGPWKKGTPAGGGAIPCPCCGGTVAFSRAGYNGHIAARCSTGGCVSWME